MIHENAALGFRLSPRQRDLWLGQSDGSRFHAQCAVTIEGELRIGALRAALDEAVARHEILRTFFQLQPGVRTPLQVVSDEAAVEWRSEALPGGDRDDGDGIEERLAAERQRAFDLDKLPLVRALLIELAPTRHLLALTLPALVADGRTLRHLLDDISRSYEGSGARGGAEDEEPLQYADFAEWQHELLDGGESEAAERAEAARREALDLAPPRLPFERPSRADRPFEAVHCRFVAPPDLATAVRECAEGLDAPPEALLLAAWHLLLARFSGRSDLRLACLFEGRGYDELEGGYGPYARWIGLPCRARSDETFREAVTCFRDQLAEAADWQHYVAGGDGETGAAEVLFEHGELPATWRADGSVLSTRSWSVCAERFQLKLSCRWIGESLSLELAFDRAAFARRDVAALGSAYLRLLASAAARPATRLPELDLHDADEPEDGGLTGSVRGGMPGRPIHRRFEEQAARTPDAPALTFAGEDLSYRELDARADRLAGRLRARGAGRERDAEPLVVLHLERSAEVVVGMLAAWKAGAAFAVVEPSLPPLRRAAMLEDLAAGPDGSPWIVTRRALAESLPGGYGAGDRVVLLDSPGDSENDSEGDPEDDPAGETAAPDPAPAAETEAGRLAYVVFTSGSTGRPKGVAVEHRQLAAYVDGVLERLDPPAGAGWATVSTFAADLGHTVLFPALVTGGRVHVVPQDRLADAAGLADELGPRPVDVLKIVPSHLRALLAATGDARLLPRRLLVMGGEACGWDLVARVRELAPDCRVVNHYGPSETTVGVIAGELEAGEETAWPPSLGRPLAAARVRLLDPRLRPVPPWMAGQIHVGGASVARGYFGRPGATAEAFMPDPLATEPGERTYRTGDLGRRRPDGRIDFLGRADDQVKIHGFRVELGEIRGALERHPAISSAAVRLVRAVAGAEGADPERLVAWYAAPSEIDTGALRDFLGESLLAEILPNAFVRVDRLPLTANGKIDFDALPSAEEALARGRRDSVAPRTPTEEALARLWAEVLGRDEPPGVLDNFFELGGHSLLATQLMARVADVFRVALPLRVLLEGPTIAEQAEAIARERAAGNEAGPVVALPELVPDPENRYEPFPLTEVQQAYWVGRSGAFELGGVSTHSYMEIDSSDLDLPRLERALRRVIERHEMLRAVVLPDGRQRILEEVPPYEIEVLDLRDADPETAERRLIDERERLAHRIQPPDRWPLFDVRATRLDGGRVRLHVSRDALIFDAWSALLFFSDLFRFYSDPDREAAPFEISYRDYVLAEERLRDTDLYRRDLDYWRRRIPELPPAPELPLAVDPSSLSEPRFARRSGTLDAAAWKRLQERAARAGLTPSGLVLAAYADILAQWSKSPRFTLNLTLFHRLPFHPQVQEVVGDFTSLTLLEVDGSTPAPFALRARRIQERLWEDLEHRHVSGVRVQRELARQRRRTGGALAPVVLTSTLALDLTFREETLRGMSAQIGYGLAITSQVWLDHSASEQEDGSLLLHWNAVEELFPEGILDTMFGAYSALLARLAEDEAAWHEEGRPWLPESELVARRAANDTAAPLPDGLLHEPFFARATEQPEAPAVIDARRTVGYGDLAGLACRIGADLRAYEARPNTLVAVVMEKGWEQVAAVLGVHVAGAAYLPIDPALPRERRFQLFEQGEAAIALTQPWLADRLEWPDGVRVIAVGDEALAEVSGAPEAGATLDSLQAPGDLAYVLFTSGSTGTPKGVMMTHRAALNTVVDVNRRFAVVPGDRVLALSSLGFDLSVWDLFGVLGTGGAVVLPEPAAARDPGRWIELVESHGVTLWNTVPALLEMLVEYAAGRPRPPRLAGLRLALLSGDWIPLDLPGRLRRLAPGARVISLGGATEAAIWSILRPVEEADPAWPSVPYGRPMANQRFHVLDHRLEPRPVWVPGQLYIAGDGLAEGYWRDEERTAASFFEHPESGERLYRTGDLGRYLPDGEIEFLGREDQQVKVQGHRIELGEIEAMLERHPAVRSAVATAPGERGERRLVAYVVAREGAAEGEGSAATPVPARRIDDPIERLRFKLSEPGLRRALPGDLGAGVALARAEADPDVRTAFYLERRSHRRFGTAPLALGQLAGLLDTLAQARIPGRPTPKYRYASASGLYPVQTYLWIKPGRVDGLGAGAYYFDPCGHRLVPLSEASGEGVGRDVYSAINRPLFDGAAFGLFLVARLNAIEPLYGESSHHYAAIEAGLMTQLLEMSAPGVGLGLCQIGGLDFDRVRPFLALDPDHRLVHSLLGGLVDPDDPGGLTALQGDAAEAALLESLRPGAGSGAPAGDLAGELRAFLHDRLPEYMVPPTLVFLDALPLTDNGKVDRKSLPEPGEVAPADDAPRAAVAPAGRLEEAVAAIWSQVLGVEEPGAHDNFFDLGGSSVGMVQVHAKLTAVLGGEIPITELFRHPTVASLAASIEESGGPAGPGGTVDAPDAAVNQARDVAARQRERMERQRRRRESGRDDA